MASASCSPPAAARAPPRSAAAPGKKLTCLCSPTSHPGSFRCSRHRNGPRSGPAAPGGEAGISRAAKGRSVRALLLQMISPSERGRQRQRQRGRGDFQPRPSRLRLMTK